MQTTISTLGEFALSQASLITALGLPANTVINDVLWDNTAKIMTVQAIQPGTPTGTP